LLDNHSTPKLNSKKVRKTGRQTYSYWITKYTEKYKSQGPDGLINEFDKFFWSDIGIYLLRR
jgi:hypothetical protein